MLQSIREKTSGWIAVVILGLVILTMAFFGIESYVTGKVETYAAKIEGPARFLKFGGQVKEISANDFRTRLDRVRQSERAEQGKDFDATAFESLQKKREVLDQMIDEALLDLVAQKAGMVLSKAAVQKQILGMQEFQVGGKFDPKQYQLILSGQQMTPRQFEQLIKADLLQRMIPQELLESGFSSDGELDNYLRTSRQTRDVRFIELAPAFPTLPAPTDADIKAWYDGHIAQYRSPEKVAIEYVELNAATMSVDTVADEASLRERYEATKGKYGTVEQRLASHILVKLDEKAGAAEVAAALAKAKDLAAKARAPGADFAALAKANSDDLGSRDAGGDLGAVEKGVFGDDFDKAFFALQPGQVSDPVRLPDGWHVIQYRELVPGTAKSFEEVRPELEAEYLESERERAYNDVAGKLVDAVYAKPTELVPAAQDLKLPVLRTGLFTRDGGDGIAALPQVRAAAFNESQKKDRQVSDPIEIEPNHSVVLHVIDVQPAASLPLASIRDRVLADIQADRVAQASKEAADALLARAEKGESLDAIAASLGKTVASLPGVPRVAPAPQMAPLIDKAFSLPKPEAGKESVGLAKVGGDRYLLVGVTAVKDGDPASVDAATRDNLRTQIGKARGAVEGRAFIKNLRKQYKITVAEDRL